MLDTTSGHETLAVDYLKKVLEAEGIPTKTFAINPASGVRMKRQMSVYVGSWAG